MPARGARINTRHQRLSLCRARVDGIVAVSRLENSKDGGHATCCAAKMLVNCWRSVGRNVIPQHGAINSSEGVRLVTRQSHIVTPRAFMNTDQNAISSKAEDGRIIFTIP